MHPRVLSELADVVTKPLLMVFEKLWQLGEVPGDQKKGNITPIYKKAKKDDPRNYQPVSLTFVHDEVDPTGSYAKAHGRQGGDTGELAWPHQGQVLLDQPSDCL